MDKEAILTRLLKKMVALRLPKGAVSATRRISKSRIKALPKSTPEWFKKSVHGVKSHDKAWKAYREQSVSAGDESLLLWPLRALASKTLPEKYKEQAGDFMWKYIGAPALRADATIGRGLEKIPLVGKHLFRMKDEVPWGKGLKRTIHRSSALAPFVKARDVAEPILVGVGLEKGIKKLDEMRRQGKGMQDDQLRTKVASVMLQLHEKNKEHEKRAHALKLLYKQVELGMAQMPLTHGELETKLASLANEDLVVLEKALELSGGSLKLGELGRMDPGTVLKPAEKFQAALLGDEN